MTTRLRVAEIGGGVGVVDATRETGLVGAVRPHVVAALTHHNRGARVLTSAAPPRRRQWRRRACGARLAAGQYASSGDVGVLEELKCYKSVVVARLGVVQDVGELLQVARTEKVRYVRHRLGGSHARSLGWFDGRAGPSGDDDARAPEPITAGAPPAQPRASSSHGRQTSTRDPM